MGLNGNNLFKVLSAGSDPWQTISKCNSYDLITMLKTTWQHGFFMSSRVGTRLAVSTLCLSG